MSSFIDQVLRVLKWPLAVLLVCAWPATLEVWTALVEESRQVGAPLLAFGIGALTYFALWWCLLREGRLGSFFSTLEHELTHALFAWLTLHRVVSIRATWSSGGSVRYRGQGNWLINLAPYFFPTLALPLGLAYVYSAGTMAPWVNVIFGAVVAYHIVSTLRETHPRQTDLTESGLVFSAMVLPPLNLMSYGALLALAVGGRGGLSTHYAAWLERYGEHLDVMVGQAGAAIQIAGFIP